MTEFYLAAEPAPVLLGPHVDAVSYFTSPPADDSWAWSYKAIPPPLGPPFIGVTPFIAYYDRRTGRLLGTSSFKAPVE